MAFSFQFPLATLTCVSATALPTASHRKEMCYPRAYDVRLVPLTGNTLWRNTASVIKEML